MADESVDPLEQRDEEQKTVELKRLLETLDDDAQKNTLALLLKDESVRDLLWRILQKAHVWRQTWDPNNSKSSFNDGERNIGLWLFGLIGEADPNALAEMQLKSARIAREQERLAAQESERRRRRNATTP